MPFLDSNQIEKNLGEYMVGKKCLLIVNVASGWPFAKKNYQQLVKMDQRYRDRGLVIVGFPCN
jgi:glutathione peroxidase-family protein